MVIPVGLCAHSFACHTFGFKQFLYIYIKKKKKNDQWTELKFSRCFNYEI